MLSNSTIEHNNITIAYYVAGLINRGVNAVCGPVVAITAFLLLILSFCWSLYLLTGVIKGFRKKERYINRDMKEEVIESILKNKKNNRIKNFILFAICVSECTFIVSLLAFSSTHYLRDKDDIIPKKLFSSSFHKISFTFSDSLYSTWARFQSTVCFNFFLFLILLIRILTQYMANCYSFFHSNYSLKFQFIRSVVMLIALTFIGTFQITIFLYRILYNIQIIYEFILFLRASTNLRKVLYKRFFDAKVHENQSPHVIAYYKRAHTEYRITSVLLALALLGHIASMCILSLHQLIVTVLYQPGKLGDILIGHDLDITYIDLPISLKLYDILISSLIEISFTLETYYINMNEISLLINEIDKEMNPVPVQSSTKSLNKVSVKSETSNHKIHTINQHNATRSTYNPGVNRTSERFLQSNMKRPSSYITPTAKRGKLSSKSFSGINSKIKIKPILPNNPNESVKTISRKRMDEIKQMKCNQSQSSQGNESSVPSEFTEIINSKSKYNWIVEEEKMAELENNIAILQKQESKIDFMKTLTDVKVTLITCTVCNYTSEKVLKKCTERYHTLTRKRVTKSYFVCKDCDYMKTVYNSSYPKSMCEGCGSVQFIKSRLPINTKGKQEELLVRGFEERSLI
ncbi:Protein MCM10-like [Oopsacas minuta]|uniref:Protein MCM10-like n=1 Tax=Oopsacas minuta TaxID=111878 RepID=A0AAV7JKQ7_9METZ|nr:Protein MCM10-like [Oopsacas minuta]